MARIRLRRWWRRVKRQLRRHQIHELTHRVSRSINPGGQLPISCNYTNCGGVRQGVLFGPIPDAKLLGDAPDFGLRAGRETPGAGVGRPAFGVGIEHRRLVPLRIERNRDQIDTTAEMPLKISEIRGEPGTGLRRRTAGVDKVNQDHPSAQAARARMCCHPAPRERNPALSPGLQCSSRRLRRKAAAG